MATSIVKSFSVWMRQSRNWRIISARSMLSRFFQQLTIAYNNIYIRELGANPIQLGMINSISRIADTLLSTPFGWLQDRYSLRKIFLIGIGITLIVRLNYAMATGWIMIIPAMLLSPFVMRIGSCLTICDVSVKNEDRSICKGICDCVFGTPALVAPTLAALLITYFGGMNVEGIKPLYWIQFIADFILFLFLILQLKEILRPKMGTSSFIGGYREVFQRGTALKRWILFSTVDTFLMNMIGPFMLPFAHEIKGADQFILGGMTTAGLAIQILFSIPLANISERIGRKRVIYLVEPLYWVSLLLLVYTPSKELLIVSSILGGFRMIAGFISISPLMVELVPIDCIGRWRGILGLFGGLVSIPAPIVGGIIWETINPSYLFLIAMVIDMFVRIPLLSTIPEKKHS